MRLPPSGPEPGPDGGVFCGIKGINLAISPRLLYTKAINRTSFFRQLFIIRKEEII
jgi:hypothetical protein